MNLQSAHTINPLNKHFNWEPDMVHHFSLRGEYDEDDDYDAGDEFEEDDEFEGSDDYDFEENISSDFEEDSASEYEDDVFYVDSEGSDLEYWEESNDDVSMNSRY